QVHQAARRGGPERARRTRRDPRRAAQRRSLTAPERRPSITSSAAVAPGRRRDSREGHAPYPAHRRGLDRHHRRPDGRMPGPRPSRTELDAAPGPDHRADGEPDVATAIDSNHVIVVGDSLMESTTVRYGASMCKSLVPRGWAVETIAETGQHVDFGLRVIDERFDPDWDVAVVMLGNNYRGNQQAFEEQLDQIIQRLTLRPTVMFTVTEFEPAQADVNE